MFELDVMEFKERPGSDFPLAYNTECNQVKPSRLRVHEPASGMLTRTAIPFTFPSTERRQRVVKFKRSLVISICSSVKHSRLSGSLRRFGVFRVVSPAARGTGLENRVQPDGSGSE